MMNKYKNKVLISLVAVLILALAGCWIFQKFSSSDFMPPNMEPYGEGDTYYSLSEDYILDGKVIYEAGYYEAVKLVSDSDFCIYVPIDPDTFERLPSEHFSDGTVIEIEGKNYEIHIQNNQYSATLKEEQELPQDSMQEETNHVSQQTYSAKEVGDVQKKYDPLYQNFSEFHRLIITDQGNWDEELSDENGNVYFRLKEENYQNTEDVKELLENTFSVGYIETRLQWVLDGEYPMFREIDGNLCIAMQEYIVQPLGENVDQIEELSEERIIFLTKYKNEELSEEAMYKITLIQENDRWVIDGLEIL